MQAPPSTWPTGAQTQHRRGHCKDVCMYPYSLNRYPNQTFTLSWGPYSFPQALCKKREATAKLIIILGTPHHTEVWILSFQQEQGAGGGGGNRRRKSLQLEEVASK